MLPFLQPKKISSVIIAKRGKSPDLEAASEVEAPGHEIEPGLKSVAEDMLRAIESKSVIDLARAIKAGHEVCEEYPHEEGPHLNEEDEA